MTAEPQDYTIPTPQGALFARRWGEAGGVPLVLLHDSLGCVELWRDFPALLMRATGRSVIAYDRLGFGRSDPHPDPLPPLSFVTDEATGDFARVAAFFGLEGFVLLGHSVGGGMGVGVAATYPERCRALVTISAQMMVEDRTLAGVRVAQRVFSDPDQRARLRRYHGDKADRALNAWFDTWLSDDFAGWNLDGALARTRCPILAIHGAQDEYGSAAHPQRIAAHAPGPVEIDLREEDAHFPHRSSEAAVVERVAAFLARAV